MASLQQDTCTFLHLHLKRDATKEVPDMDPAMTYANYAETYLPRTLQIIALLPAPMPLRRIITSFIDNTCADSDLPYDAESVANILTTPLHRSKFLATQSRFLVDDIPEGTHRDYQPSDFIPFAPVKDTPPRSGAFGTVIKVQFVRDPNKVYACKELILDRREEAEGVWGYRAELDILAGLNHTHLVKLRCSYTQNHKAYIIMSPYAPLSLLDFLKTPDGHQWYAMMTSVEKKKMLLGWLSCLASALVYLHDANIKHKDIKPDNILLDKDTDTYPLPLLTDFGISKKFSLSQGSGSLLPTGTEFWQAPEHLRKERAGRSADVFALGGIFFLLLALGHGNSTNVIISTLRGSTRNPIPGFATNLEDIVVPYIDEILQASTDTGSAWQLVKKMMSSNPVHRPTAREVWKELKDILKAAGCPRHCDNLTLTPANSQELFENEVGVDEVVDAGALLAKLRLERESSGSLW